MQPEDATNHRRNFARSVQRIRSMAKPLLIIVFEDCDGRAEGLNQSFERATDLDRSPVRIENPKVESLAVSA